MLNQQPFELLISAIVSANNNLKRIKSIVEKICAACGEPFLAEGRRFYRFPVPERLAALTEEELLDCGCGYRAPYILASARAVADGFDLEKVGMLPYGQAKAELCRLPGVGPKVADCILLFSLRKTDAFPADVWIKRVMERLYGFTGNDKQLYAFAREKFGPYAGIAQQYLFYYARETMGR